MTLGVPEGLEGRHLYVIRAFGVVGAGSAVPDVGAGRGKEPVGYLDALRQGEGRGVRFRGQVRGQAFALLGIGHGVAFHEGDRALALRTIFIGLAAGDAVGVDDELAMLALAHVSAQLLRLFEFQPEGTGIAFCHGGHPPQLRLIPGLVD